MTTNNIRYLYSTETGIELIFCENSTISYPLHNHISVLTIGIILDGNVILTTNQETKVYKQNETFAIEGYCRTLADAINLPKTFIQLRDFVQIINRTGIETPRLVYMYQSALYLYNLRRAYSPFNFYVVDTPNQQGQDANNLESIFKSLELFLSDEGQVIVGTERETGLEEKAGNVIQLSEKRRCLNDFNYSTHLELLEKLQKVAIEWVAINHKAKTNE